MMINKEKKKESEREVDQLTNQAGRQQVDHKSLIGCMIHLRPQSTGTNIRQTLGEKKLHLCINKRNVTSNYAWPYK